MTTYKIDYQIDRKGEFSQKGLDSLKDKESQGDIFDVKVIKDIDGGVLVSWSKNETTKASDTCVEGAMYKMEQGFALAASITKWTKLSHEVM